jgi:hypothetical protein
MVGDRRPGQYRRVRRLGGCGLGAALAFRFTWMAAKEIDQYVVRPTTFIEAEGTFLKAALDVSRNFGAVPAPELPVAGGLSAREMKTFYALAAQRKIASYNAPDLAS